MRKHSIPVFIQQTWKMLENEQNWTVICWNNDDTSFLILDQAEIAQNLLPKYFKHSNFSSFIRQLNMYNFRKRKTPDGHIEFNHKLFRKNQKQLLIGIKRKPSEAEMLEADQLIKQLAPQCFIQTKSAIDDEVQAVKEEEMISQIGFQQMQLEEQNRSLFAMMSWYLNGYGFTPCWQIQKNIKQNIILIQPPAMDFPAKTL